MKECPHCRELAEDNADVCLNCGWKFGSEEEVLRNNDIYEYDVRYVIDQPTGEEDTETIKALMNEYAAKGWRLHTVYVNELGKSAVNEGTEIKARDRCAHSGVQIPGFFIVLTVLISLFLPAAAGSPGSGCWCRYCARCPDSLPSDTVWLFRWKRYRSEPASPHCHRRF